MKEKYKKFFKELFASVTLSLYPVSYLYQVNSNKLTFNQTALPFIIVCSTAVILFMIFKTLELVKIQINNIQLIIPVFSIIIFMFGFFIYIVQEQNPTGYVRIRYIYILILLTTILFIYLISSLKNKVIYQSLISFLIILNLLPYIALVLESFKFPKKIASQKNINVITNLEENVSDPDIYYIILDMYPSGGVLKKYWNFDNSKFISDLNGLGFKVFNDSKSNYPRTYLSINSILNMQYIHKQNDVKQDYLTQEYLSHTLTKNRVSTFLKNRGYNYYIFEGGIIPKSFNKTPNEHFLSPFSNPNVLNNQTTPDNDFLLLFINNSIFFPFADRIQSISLNMYRKRIYYVLDKLPELCKQSDRKFVVAHIICPHPPYIFGENGEETFVNERSVFRKKAFINQVKFINKSILPVIKKMLVNDNERNKIIILQADHGTREIEPNNRYSFDESWSQACFGNLNAIYMSDSQKIRKMNYVSPVNTFRQLFNIEFKEKYFFLPDEHYYTDYQFPLIFHELTK